MARACEARSRDCAATAEDCLRPAEIGGDQAGVSWNLPREHYPGIFVSELGENKLPLSKLLHLG